MCCTSIFTSIMAMVHNFSITLSFPNFLWIFFCKCNVLLGLDVILALFLLTTTFFFQNQLYFLRVFLKIYKIFSYNFFCDTNYAYFLYNQMPNQLALNICIECFSIFLLKIFWIVCTSIYFLIEDSSSI